MNAQFAVAPRVNSRSVHVSTYALAYCLLAAGSVSYWFVALVLAIGRWTGSTGRTLSPGLLFVTVATVTAIGALQRIGWKCLGVLPRRSSSAGWIWWSVCSAGVLLFGSALIGSQAVGIVAGLSWLVVIGTEIVSWTAPWFGSLSRIRLPRPLPLLEYLRRTTFPRPRTDPTPHEQTPSRPSPTVVDTPDLEPPPDVVQQIMRSRQADGVDVVDGLLRARFEVQQRSQVLHVAFCPPMAQRPNVSVFQMSGPASQLKTSEVQTYGIRIDVRLARAPTEPQNVLVHFEARSTDNGSH